jgi:hypothetical protein
VRILTYGDIMDGGASVFTSVAKLDVPKLIISFSGAIRVDNPYRYLATYVSELEERLPPAKVESIELDFTELNFCNSNGFYVIMDIVEILYSIFPVHVTVKRLKEDDWQQETLPILLNVDEPEIGRRTSFEDFSEI